MHCIHREAVGSKAKTAPANTKRVLIATVKKVKKLSHEITYFQQHGVKCAANVYYFIQKHGTCQKMMYL